MGGGRPAVQTDRFRDDPAAVGPRRGNVRAARGPRPPGHTGGRKSRGTCRGPVAGDGPEGADGDPRLSGFADSWGAAACTVSRGGPDSDVRGGRAGARALVRRRSPRRGRRTPLAAARPGTDSAGRVRDNLAAPARRRQRFSRECFVHFPAVSRNVRRRAAARAERAGRAVSARTPRVRPDVAHLRSRLARGLFAAARRTRSLAPPVLRARDAPRATPAAQVPTPPRSARADFYEISVSGVALAAPRVRNTPVPAVEEWFLRSPDNGHRVDAPPGQARAPMRSCGKLAICDRQSAGSPLGSGTCVTPARPARASRPTPDRHAAGTSGRPALAAPGGPAPSPGTRARPTTSPACTIRRGAEQDA
jgi:hypothetical protein